MQNNPYSSIKKVLADEIATLHCGSCLALALHAGMIIYLIGPLGAGKTTLVRGMLRGLGYRGKVKSPTFTLVEEYQLSKHTIFHFDFYRLNVANELNQMGILDYFTKEAICVIEWPEQGAGYLPAADIVCQLMPCEHGREFTLMAHSACGEAMLRQLHEFLPNDGAS